MTQPLRTLLAIARYTILESRRTFIVRAGISGFAAVFLLALFIAHTALTEPVRIEVTMYAVLVRIVLAAVIGLGIISNTVRDLESRLTDNFLALSIPRMRYVLGKWLGYATVAVLLALLAAAPLALFAGTPGRLAWALSLAAESLVTASLALLLGLSLGRVVTATLAYCAIYVFARIGFLVVLLGATTRNSTHALVDRIDSGYVEFATYLLPRLDRFAETAWLTGGAVRFGPDLVQAAIYLALLGTVASFEINRKEF
jgi:hypothetical protein